MEIDTSFDAGHKFFEPMSTNADIFVAHVLAHISPEK